ncbi:DNA polymerase Y family protein [Usitatibacter palustris]|uniref:DNA polymerase IV n=1 Tax=Usitatibacter palustris TaxID=2732487 RepID=A0A6M4H4R6_9PROT|nr:DNA polymerase [Usitatibacter palustris]QJR13948.1 DNA polymerase IV [Usitatibacter palustris]
MTLRSLLVDFNSYFASVEQQVEPRLRGKPLGVVPMLADTTVCIAASVEAKTFGVKTGTKVADARKLCPQIEFVVARHEIYIDFHHRAVAVVDSVVPVRAVLSIDEMDCELTGRWREPARALKIAADVKAKLTTEIGECLRTSIGIGPNTFIAKTASDMVKPDGLVIIEKAELPDRLFHLPVRALSGVGKQMEKRLHEKGLKTVQDLCARSRDELRAIWGGIGGEIMYDRLRGEAMHERESETGSISHSSVLGPEKRNPTDAYAVLDRLIQKAAMRLRKADLYAARMSIGVKYLDGARWDADMKLVDTQDTMSFLHVLEKLWSQRPPTRRTILQVGMAFSDLVTEAKHTGSLFASEDKSKALYATLDKLNVRFGRQAVYFASAHKARDRGGLHIAFNHIPDPETER